MALGGITPDNILEIKDFGFGGAVVLGDLWNKFNVCTDRDYLGVIRHFKKLKEMADSNKYQAATEKLIAHYFLQFVSSLSLAK